MMVLRKKQIKATTEIMLSDIVRAANDCNCNPHIKCPICLVGRG